MNIIRKFCCKYYWQYKIRNKGTMYGILVNEFDVSYNMVAMATSNPY